MPPATLYAANAAVYDSGEGLAGFADSYVCARIARLRDLFNRETGKPETPQCPLQSPVEFQTFPRDDSQPA